MKPETFQQQLKRLGACHDGRAWVGRRDLATAWHECERADWLLWLAGRSGVDRRVLVQAAADCAETALQYVPDGENRPRRAIEAARRWADDPSAENLEVCREAAYAAAYVASRAYAYADAAYAAYAAAYAATYATAAADAAAYASRVQRLAEMVVLVRRRITAEMVAVALNNGGR